MDSGPSAFSGHRGPVGFLAAVTSRMEHALRAPEPTAGASPRRSLEQAAGRLALAPRAKRARALLVADVARHVGVADPEAVVDVAAAIELIHAASLLHDDVVDEADLRRGEPTARAAGGNAFAVLCGDLVLSRALSLVAPRGAAVVDACVRVIEEMTRAALVELEDRGRFDVPLSRWTAMATGKTGALFGLCARLPCILVEDGDRAARLERALRSFGVAFQIVDDVIDLRGADPGKPRGQDVRERQPSLPILCAVARDPDLVPLLRAPADDEQVLTALCERLLLAGLAPAIDAARACVQDALDALGDDAAGLREVIAWANRLVEAALRAAGNDEGIPARAP